MSNENYQNNIDLILLMVNVMRVTMKKIIILFLVVYLSACTLMIESEQLDDVKHIALVSLYINKDIGHQDGRSKLIDSYYQNPSRYQLEAEQLILTDMLVRTERELQALNIWQIVPSAQFINDAGFSQLKNTSVFKNSDWVIKQDLPYIALPKPGREFAPEQKKYIRQLCEQLSVDAIAVFKAELSYKGTGVLGGISDSGEIISQAESRFVLVTKDGKIGMDSSAYPSLFLGPKLVLPLSTGKKQAAFRLIDPQDKYTLAYLNVVQDSTEYVLNRINREILRLGPNVFERIEPVAQSEEDEKIASSENNTEQQVEQHTEQHIEQQPPYAKPEVSAIGTTVKKQRQPRGSLFSREAPLATESKTSPPSTKSGNTSQRPQPTDRVEMSSAPAARIESAISQPPLMDMSLPTEVDDIEIDLGSDDDSSNSNEDSRTNPWAIKRYREAEGDPR